MVDSQFSLSMSLGTALGSHSRYGLLCSDCVLHLRDIQVCPVSKAVELEPSSSSRGLVFILLNVQIKQFQ